MFLNGQSCMLWPHTEGHLLCHEHSAGEPYAQHEWALLSLQVAPAMNTLMWESPLTLQHLTALTKLGGRVIDPVSKTLACGDTGAGAMAAVQDIAQRVQLTLAQPGDYLKSSVPEPHCVPGMYARLRAYCRTSQFQAVLVLGAALALVLKGTTR